MWHLPPSPVLHPLPKDNDHTEYEAPDSGDNTLTKDNDNTEYEARDAVDNNLPKDIDDTETQRTRHGWM